MAAMRIFVNVALHAMQPEACVDSGRTTIAQHTLLALIISFVNYSHLHSVCHLDEHSATWKHQQENSGM